jgi:hypothetical protein
MCYISSCPILFHPRPTLTLFDTLVTSLARLLPPASTFVVRLSVVIASVAGRPVADLILCLEAPRSHDFSTYLDLTIGYSNPRIDQQV